EPMLLGRDPKRANILIPAEDRQASGLHASIRQNGGAYLLKDEHSSNGTRLNGTRINADGDAVALRDGDSIEIGAEKFMVSKL
ncbi:MAG TPA: FHA domain-containing protein, partial [Candidatus Limiplasma sp.]|nr:FHA domain-containing protein [Candidatus Limiplasma sp.]